MANNDTRQFWESAWARHLEQYLTGAPRTGYWIMQRMALRGRAVLEIAGGSCRDSRFLASAGIDCTGSDFEKKTLDYLASRFSDSTLKLRQADGFSMPFDDDQFHASFHNGFWVLFSDLDIKKLALEQARITRRYMIILVHNKLNTDLVKIFEQKSRIDDLYNIRFFEPNEIARILGDTGIRVKSLVIEKFGGPVDALYRREWSGGAKWIAAFTRWFVPKLYALQPWRKVERIACIIELDK